MNYYEKSRTNYFEVKNPEVFKEYFESLGTTVVEKEGIYALIGSPENGFPTFFYNEETDEETEINWPLEVSKHLKEGSVAVFITLGEEGMRSLNGDAIAIDSEENTVQISLDDIYEMARKELDWRLNQDSQALY